MPPPPLMGFDLKTPTSQRSRGSGCYFFLARPTYWVRYRKRKLHTTYLLR